MAKSILHPVSFQHDPLSKEKNTTQKRWLLQKTSNAFEKIDEIYPQREVDSFPRSVPESLSISTQDVSTLWTLSKIAIGHPLLLGDHHFSQFHAFPRTEAGHLKVSKGSEKKLNWWDFGWTEHFDMYIYIVCVCCLVMPWKGGEILMLPIFNMSWMIFWMPFGWWPEFFQPNSAEVFCFWSRNGWFDSFQAKARSSAWQDRFFFFGWTNIWVQNFCYKEAEHHIAEEFWLNYSAIGCCHPPDELCREVEFFSQFFPGWCNTVVWLVGRSVLSSKGSFGSWGDESWSQELGPFSMGFFHWRILRKQIWGTQNFPNNYSHRHLLEFRSMEHIGTLPHDDLIWVFFLQVSFFCCFLPCKFNEKDVEPSLKAPWNLFQIYFLKMSRSFSLLICFTLYQKKSPILPVVL